MRATSKFDGWGYVSLFERKAGKVMAIDSYAIPEALDPAFAFGFGDLSVHEVAMDPGQNRAYSSYYAGGMRVFDFGASGIEEVGHYIDDDGSNFWGVETFMAELRGPATCKASACSRALTATSASRSSATPATVGHRTKRNRLRGAAHGPPLVRSGASSAQPATPPPCGSRAAMYAVGVVPANSRKSRFRCAWSK